MQKNDATTKYEMEGIDMNSALDVKKLIPDEERAVPVRAQGETSVEIERIIEPLGDLTGEVLAEERAQAEALPAGLADVSACGCFNPVLGFKGFELSSGGTIFAKVCTSPKSGRVIEFCQMYKNGTYSGKMRIKQSQFFEASLGNFGMKKTGDPVLDKRIKKFLLEVRAAYYGLLEYPEESIDVVSILTALMKAYHELPKEDDGATLLENPKKLYGKLLQIIEKKLPFLPDEHQSYFTLFNEDMQSIADELNIKKIQLLKRLKEYKFLYLTESSEGYQTCVRFSTDGEFIKASSVEWCYCILKLDYLAKRKMLQDGSNSKN